MRILLQLCLDSLLYWLKSSNNRVLASISDIEMYFYGLEEIRELLSNKDKKIGAKAWGVLYAFDQMGKIPLGNEK